MRGGGCERELSFSVSGPHPLKTNHNCMGGSSCILPALSNADIFCTFKKQLNYTESREIGALDTRGVTTEWRGPSPLDIFGFESSAIFVGNKEINRHFLSNFFIINSDNVITCRKIVYSYRNDRKFYQHTVYSSKLVDMSLSIH